jgi:hypothetical protein
MEKTGALTVDDVDNGGLVTTEHHPCSSIRLVYPVHSVKQINPSSQAFFVSNRSFDALYG